jgi:hypothetical protein
MLALAGSMPLGGVNVIEAIGKESASNALVWSRKNLLFRSLNLSLRSRQYFVNSPAEY